MIVYAWLLQDLKSPQGKCSVSWDLNEVDVEDGGDWLGGYVCWMQCDIFMGWMVGV